MRSSKAVANQVASALGMIIALILALGVALGLGVAAYALSRPDALTAMLQHSASRQTSPGFSAEFIFLSILAFIYLMWATLPLSLGGSKQFDAGRLLMYPISLGKLFAVDFVSELTTLQSIFAIPAILAMSIGAGLGSGSLAPSLIAAVPAVFFGVSLSKWLGTTIGSLVRQKRARGETVVALIGAVAGLGGALVGQVGPMLIRHAESFKVLRWTPPGAAAVIIGGGWSKEPATYMVSFAVLTAYTVALILGTFWIARRAALGLGGRKKLRKVEAQEPSIVYTGWELPLVSPELSAVLEKELRYVMRNAQIRMMALMPLILIVVRFVNSQRFGSGLDSSRVTDSIVTYGSGLLATAGVLYVFLILAGLSCNLFAFEEGGMRTLILSPIGRRKILIGKNLAVTFVALLFSAALLIVNGLVFRDLGLDSILFAVLSFIIFASIMSLIGNWFSIRFPKRMQFGKRLNTSGVAGLLLIPMLFVLAIPPVGAAALGYLTESILVEYATLAGLAVASVSLYLILIGLQGRTLERREIEILEAVKEPE